MADFFDTWISMVFFIVIALVILTLTLAITKSTRKKWIMLSSIILTASFSISSLFLLEFLIKDEVSGLIDENSLVIEMPSGIDEGLLLHSLKNNKYVTTHKTHPLEKSVVRILTNSRELKLQVAQDSKYPYLYWVYYPKYRYSRLNEIGKVRVQKYE
ncbi:hypothetical protein [Enterovibrio norvegicus]|uniref:Uncharacterized protein n=1 Tax=Enterovibrio norvegicus TaxID=188144 RepID=A0A2N7L506_9GAMM|nr:hypothetical protein [Enterovibrio norvegicus]PML76085.1 hypothetical protein BCT69_05410 [Enterovibrio norvegicus]PMN88569.1 hypothetical protein BCT23_23975 [Enterovibrio norvegicus]